MGLRDIGATLPPGFRFYPSDEELVCHYLYKKITNEEALKGTLMEIDLHTCEPWQLPEVAKLNANEWYFFSFRDRKYATGFRTNRATTTGYWKATGKDRAVSDPITREIVGMRKTLVFYRNRAPNGIKTGWIMHEFRLEAPHMPPKEDWVLCRVFNKSKGAENGTKLRPEFLLDGKVCPSDSLNSSAQLSTQTDLPTRFNLAHFTSLSTTTIATQQNQLFSHGGSLLDLLHHFPHKKDMAATNPTTEAISRNDDEYGFLWDMNLEENSFGNDNAVSSNLDDVMGDSTVFL